MGSKRVVVLDYGAGNLRSVARAVEHVGFQPEVSADPRALDDAGAVVDDNDASHSDMVTSSR